MAVRPFDLIMAKMENEFIGTSLPEPIGPIRIAQAGVFSYINISFVDKG